MQNINVYVRENVNKVARSGLHVSPNIPEKKLNNAAASMGLQDSVGSIIALLDSTVFGSGKDGIVFTGEKMVYKPPFSSPEVVCYSDIGEVKYVKNVSVNEKGKEKVEEFVKITLKGNGFVKIDNFAECHLENLSVLLNEIISRFDSFEEEDQLVTLSEMSEDLKVAYLKVIINMTYFDDNEVDKDEFAQILMLMTRLELTPESRFSLREYITSLNELEPLVNLINSIDVSCKPSHRAC